MVYNIVNCKLECLGQEDITLSMTFVGMIKSYQNDFEILEKNSESFQFNRKYTDCGTVFQDDICDDARNDCR